MQKKQNDPEKNDREPLLSKPALFTRIAVLVVSIAIVLGLVNWGGKKLFSQKQAGEKHSKIAGAKEKVYKVAGKLESTAGKSLIILSRFPLCSPSRKKL